MTRPATARARGFHQGLVVNGMTISGVIRRLHQRGFGFLEGDNQITYFFHCSALVAGRHRFDDLAPGLRVAFRPVSVDGQVRAEDVDIVDAL